MQRTLGLPFKRRALLPVFVRSSLCRAAKGPLAASSSETESTMSKLDEPETSNLFLTVPLPKRMSPALAASLQFGVEQAIGVPRR